jgi:hypothetical protein
MRSVAHGMQKSEIRNAKSETNPEPQIQNPKQSAAVSDFEFGISDLFRISDFEFRI